MTGGSYKCGHAKTPENTQGSKSPRCKTCAQERDARRRSRGGSYQQDNNRSPIHRLSKLKDEPAVLGEDPTPHIVKGTIKLRKALYREHPYVFWQARVDGRYCVLPGEVA